MFPVVGACGDDPSPPPAETSRQRLLTPRNLTEERKQLRARARVADAEGRLLPSEQRVAGIVLPRGLREVRKRDNTWYFHSRASLEALQAYFGPRLLTGQVDLGGRGTVTFVNAQPKDDKAKRSVTVRIGPAPSSPRENQVYISEAAFRPVNPPNAVQVQAQIQARRKYAD